jgi:hypothetical protein
MKPMFQRPKLGERRRLVPHFGLGKENSIDVVAEVKRSNP